MRSGRAASTWDRTRRCGSRPRARCPYGDDPLLEGQYGPLGPDAATAAQYAWRVERVTKTYAGRPEYRHLFYWETQPAVPARTQPELGNRPIPREFSPQGTARRADRGHRALGGDGLADRARIVLRRWGRGAAQHGRRGESRLPGIPARPGHAHETHGPVAAGLGTGGQRAA